MLKLLIPKGSADRTLAVQCVVVHLPLRRGVANIDRSIAAGGTREVAVVASSVINLVDGDLEAGATDQRQEGARPEPGGIWPPISWRSAGHCRNPHMGMGAKGAVRGVAKVSGRGVATGGVSFWFRSNGPSTRSPAGWDRPSDAWAGWRSSCEQPCALPRAARIVAAPRLRAAPGRAGARRRCRWRTCAAQSASMPPCVSMSAQRVAQARGWGPGLRRFINGGRRRCRVDRILARRHGLAGRTIAHPPHRRPA